MMLFDFDDGVPSDTEHLHYHDGTQRICPHCTSRSLAMAEYAADWYSWHDPSASYGPEYYLAKEQAQIEQTVEDFLAVERLISEMSGTV